MQDGVPQEQLSSMAESYEHMRARCAPEEHAALCPDFAGLRAILADVAVMWCLRMLELAPPQVCAKVQSRLVSTAWHLVKA